MYYQFSNLWLSLWNGNIYSNGSAISPKELLDKLQVQINKEIDTIRDNGCSREKILDLPILADIMLEKDLDRLDRILFYRMARHNGHFDPRLFNWLESLAMAYWFHRLTDDDLRQLLFQLAYPDEARKSTPPADVTPRSMAEVRPADVSAHLEVETGIRIRVDQRRPIAFDEEPCDFVRIDTEPLRKAQAEANDIIDRICRSHNSGNTVVSVCNLLRHLIDTDFYGVYIINELLRSSKETASGSYSDALNVLNGAAYYLECGDFSPGELREAIDALYVRNLERRRKARASASAKENTSAPS